jgi:uncharacterized protein
VARTPFHLLAKPTGAVCNLDCTYCFFLSKDSLYAGDRMRMSDSTLVAYVSQLLESQPDGPVQIAWQGGEPTLMGVDFFRRMIDIVRSMARPGQTVEHTMQTNATLIDDEWAGFLAENHFLVGVSIDGPPDLHDAYRVRSDGRGTYADVLRGWTTLRDHGVECNILCSVTATNAGRPLDVYRHLRDDLGARHIQFIPIVERATEATLETAERGWGTGTGRRRILYRQEGDRHTSRSVTGAQYGRFLCEVFDEWLSADVGEVYVQMFDTALGAHLGMYSLCVHAPTCGGALALEHNGDVYSCDHFVEPDYLLGNIHRTHLAELVSAPVQVEFGRNKATTLPAQCRRCPVLFACNGGCPKDRFAISDDGEPGLNHLCDGYLSFFQHTSPAFRRMAELLSAGRYADEIAPEVAAGRFPRFMP